MNGSVAVLCQHLVITVAKRASNQRYQVGLDRPLSAGRR